MFIRLVTALELIHSPPHTHFWSFHALTFTPSTSRCGFSRLMDVFINLSWRFALLLLSFYTSVRGLPVAFYLPLSLIAFWSSTFMLVLCQSWSVRLSAFDSLKLSVSVLYQDTFTVLYCTFVCLSVDLCMSIARSLYVLSIFEYLLHMSVI